MCVVLKVSRFHEKKMFQTLIDAYFFFRERWEAQKRQKESLLSTSVISVNIIQVRQKILKKIHRNFLIYFHDIFVRFAETMKHGFSITAPQEQVPIILKAQSEEDLHEVSGVE